MKIKSILFAILFLTMLILAGCASEAAPGGGPPDKTPPLLIETNVQSGSTNIPVDQKINFFFSENLNPDNIEKNVMIFPISDETIKIRAGGRNLSVSPGEAWDPDVVYTLIVGKGISDLRGNSIEQPIQISFTSGPDIPDNHITGRVSGLTSGTSATIALSRKSVHPDSILNFPEYYTQTGPDGYFSFDYLPSDEFYIAGYIDLDKSNSYKARFDGACIPAAPRVLPDTSASVLMMEAVYDNFLTGKVIKAESIDPMTSEITFSKDPGMFSDIKNITHDSSPVDTVIFHNNVCTVYHQPSKNDSFSLSISGLIDQVGLSFEDSVFYLPSIDWPDSFYHVDQIGNALRITPDPKTDRLNVVFQSKADTTDITLSRLFEGFYRLPVTKSQQKGTYLIKLPFLNTQAIGDSLYSADVTIAPLPEYGAVLGTLDTEAIQQLRLVLHNETVHYELSVPKGEFSFKRVLPGSYALSYYIDKNGNGRRDVGRPFPHESPEFLQSLDKGIDVRARWDTDLEAAYKIVIENNK